jgi:twitching motility protein PilT
MQTYRKQGMITMDDAILELYRSQKITREMALQFAQDPETMQNKMLR